MKAQCNLGRRRIRAAFTTLAGEAKFDRCLTSAPSHGDCAEFEGYKLGESVWDAALLVGLSETCYVRPLICATPMDRGDRM